MPAAADPVLSLIARRRTADGARDDGSRLKQAWSDYVQFGHLGRM